MDLSFSKQLLRVFFFNLNKVKKREGLYRLTVYSTGALTVRNWEDNYLAEYFTPLSFYHLEKIKK